MLIDLNAEDLRDLLPVRKKDSHKGDYGRVLVIAGSKGMAGASFLCAKAAYLAGAGLVTVFAPEENRVILQTLLPEAMVISYDPSENKWQETCMLLRGAWKASDCLAVGPGMGQSETAVRILRTVILSEKERDKAMVLDADALNILSRFPDLSEDIAQRKVILTPHMGEMSRLCGKPVSMIAEDPDRCAREYCSKAKAALILKNAETRIAFPESDDLYINRHAGNNGMSTGGSGDVLCGLITGFLAQSDEMKSSALSGVLTHALAGDAAAEKKGVRSMTAQDILDAVPDVLKRYEQDGKDRRAG